MERKQFVTSDVWLAAALTILLNNNPTFTVHNNKTFFIYPADDSTYRAIADFNSGIQIDAFLYSETVKKLRVEMFTQREKGAR